MLNRHLVPSLLTALGLMLSACDRATAPPPEPRELAASNSAVPTANLITSGQPEAEDLDRLQALGVTRVINLRTPEEDIPFDEQARAESLGMEYVTVPVAGAEDVTKEKALELDSLLEEDEKIFLHCASGNRVGALLALRAYYVEGATVDEAMAVGKAAGMTSLADRVAYVLAGEEMPRNEAANNSESRE